MVYRSRDHCIEGEPKQEVGARATRRLVDSTTSKQLRRLACGGTDPEFLKRLEADDVTVQDNVALFLRIFSPNRSPEFKPKSYAIFENPEYNTNLPKVFIVHALTHLKLGSTAGYCHENEVEEKLAPLPGYGSIDMGISFEPNDDGRVDVYASLLAGVDSDGETVFSSRALGVLQRTVDEINY